LFLSATHEVVFYFLETDMQTPIHPLVAEMVSKLDPSLREEFEERAAILEFEAAMLRDHAECLALLEVIKRHPEVLICSK
jgi:hypothetical protein